MIRDVTLLIEATRCYSFIKLESIKSKVENGATLNQKTMYTTLMHLLIWDQCGFTLLRAFSDWYIIYLTARS